MADDEDQPELIPVASRPISLVPVGLKEAALDSPSFRATASHFFEQVEAVEKWLDGLIKAIVKVSSESTQFEPLITAATAAVIPPNSLSEAIFDHDYTLPAAQRYADISKVFWAQAFASLKKLETSMTDPIRHFLHNDVRSFRDLRRQLESSRNAFDQASARFAALLKSKEPSSIREEAFQLHEARRVYLKASLDISIAAPQLRVALDKVLIKAFHGEGQTMWKPMNQDVGKWAADLERLRGWVREMEEGEKSFRRDIQAARKQLEDATEAEARPSRELDDYALSTAPVTLLTKGPAGALPSAKPKTFEKQGWLYIRTLTGKPTRTVWLRRWFYVKNGLFGCLIQGSRSGGVEETDRIGVLLCGIRAAATEERRFCFEVKTKDVTIVLQAETQAEMVEWMGTFDLAKQKALEDPASTDTFSTSTSSVLDPAFAITPPSAPEFTANPAEAGMHATPEEGGHDRGTGSLTLPVTDTISSLHRSSFYITASRRSTALDKDPESSRERLMQKLDISRKTSTGLTGSGSQTSGIASLISATHASMPVGPGAMPAQSTEQPTSKPIVATKPIVNSNRLAFLARTMPPSSLAPSTLANPPAATNLSSTAVAVNSERGIGIGSADKTGGMPGGILANLWGSTNWGYINRFERGEVKPHPLPSASPDSDKAQAALGTGQRQGTTDSMESIRAPSTSAATNIMASDKPALHIKAASVGDPTDLQKSAITSIEKREFPNYYPVQLKHQDAQFRLLFPNVKRSEKLVLVFRATWVPSEQQEFPGRVYVTPDHIFFYSNHLGLVLVTGFELNRVTEVTSAHGRDCDFLFLHLKGAGDELDFARLTIKSFLHNFKLLEKRLNFLVDNCNSKRPLDLESIMKAMIRLESEAEERSPNEDDMDELASIDSFRYNRANRDLRTKILVEKGLSSSVPSLIGREGSMKFKLPNKPVVYVPRGMSSPIVERTYNISPKALFHVLFGDRSAVWQLLYLERRARNIKQGPWVKAEQSHMRRAFEYDVGFDPWIGAPSQAHVVDTQIIDVHNDHLCYVVTDRKTPWHLPYHNDYTMHTKIVITHETKSKSKLALYARVDWHRSPFIVGAILERHALADLHLDALDLTDVVSEQVRKLGAFSSTKKSLQIFGSIGQQTQTIEFQDIESSLRPPRRKMDRRSLIALIFNALTNLNANLIASIVALGLSSMRWMWRTVGIHRVLIAILVVSMIANFVLSSRESSLWWRERNARHYMRQLGIGKDLVMNKAIYFEDLDLATAVEGLNTTDPTFDPCLDVFVSASSSWSTTLNPPDPSVLHLQRSRQRIGLYRHDLVVAMRVVNKIEQEMIRAGWEDWVLTETQRCDDMNRLLKMHEKDGNSSGTNEVHEQLDVYCSSCKAAQQALIE